MLDQHVVNLVTASPDSLIAQAQNLLATPNLAAYAISVLGAFLAIRSVFRPKTPR